MTDALMASLMGSEDLCRKVGHRETVAPGSGKGGEEEGGGGGGSEREGESVKYSSWPPVCSAANMLSKCFEHLSTEQCVHQFNT